MEDFEYRFPRPVRFRLGLNTIDAVAKPIDRLWPHVFQANIVEGGWHSFIRRWLPSLLMFLQRFVRMLFPRYALPSRVVIKKLRDPFVDSGQIVDLKESFKNEKTMYQRLKPLQGERIPVFYGEGWCEGKSALILSYLSGTPLLKQTNQRLEVEEFEERLRRAYDDLIKYNVSYNDVSLANLVLEGERIFFVDLEEVEEPDPGDLEYTVECNVRGFVRRYKNYLLRTDDDWD